jgi:hypothetical protein
MDFSAQGRSNLAQRAGDFHNLALTVLAPVVRIFFGPGLLRTRLVVSVVWVGLQLAFVPLPTALFLAIGL